MSRGRPRKPTAELIGNGTYQESKHGGRHREPQFDGVPKKPRGLGKIASKFWDAVVPDLHRRGVAKAIDASSLELLCVWWERVQELKAIEDKDYRIDCRLSMASKQYHQLAAKFGMTPADRTRIAVELTDGAADNPFIQFLKQRLADG